MNKIIAKSNTKDAGNTSNKDMMKYNLKKEYLTFLKMEIDDTFDSEKRIGLINQYISTAKDLLNYGITVDKKEIMLELIRLYHLKLDLLDDPEEKSKTFADIRKLILPELKE
jgi:hypothetical protein